MKRIACLGTLIAPVGRRSVVSSNSLIDFYSDVREFCRTHQIGYTVIVSEQTVLVMMEGEAPALGALTRKLNADERIIDISVVSNEQIAEPGIKENRIQVLRPGKELQAGVSEKLFSLIGDRLNLKKPFDQRRFTQLVSKSRDALSSSSPNP